MGLLPLIAAEAYPIRGAVIRTPAGRELLLEGAESALVLVRQRFDQLLVEQAQSAGVQFHDGQHIVDIRRDRDGWLEITSADRKRFSARWVVVATGATGRLGAQVRAESGLLAMVGWYRNVEFRRNTLELYYDSQLAPHYGWLFPEGPDRVNIGVCFDRRGRSGRPTREVFEAFLRRHFSQRLDGAQRLGTRGHPIATTAQISAQPGPVGVLRVGEAARLANYATGEGISTALASGQLAAMAIAMGERRAWSQQRAMDWYSRACRKQLGPRLWISARAATAAPRALDIAARLGKNATIRALLAKGLARI